MFFDLIMPKIDGDKLCHIVRKMPHLKDCYLVILSAAVAELDFDHTEIGADAYIAKGPFNLMGKHLLAASVMAAPATIVLAKILGGKVPTINFAGRTFSGSVVVIIVVITIVL